MILHRNQPETEESNNKKPKKPRQSCIDRISGRDIIVPLLNDTVYIQYNTKGLIIEDKVTR